MFLTRTELYNLTEYRRPADQIRWLRAHGYPFEIGAKGSPKVLRSEVERRLSGDRGPRRRRHNFDALKKVG